MAEREDPSSHEATSGTDPDRADHCAPIRQTLAGELGGLYRFATARLGNKAHMAEDVVQQALLIALAHASPPPEVQRQRGWVRGIVHNVIRREMRSLRRGREALQRTTFENPGPHPDGVASSAHEADESRARTVRALYLAVTELDQADQDLFYSFYRSGQSHASIAADLGTTTKGVETRLYRMRSRLRTALERCRECHS